MSLLVIAALSFSFACVTGCGPSIKKKVAAPETTDTVATDPTPKWESAGETMPPEKNPNVTVEKTTPATPAKPGATPTPAAGTKPGATPAAATAAATPAAPAKGARGKTPPAKGAKPGTAVAAAPSGPTPATLVPDDELLKRPTTFENVEQPATPKAAPGPLPPPVAVTAGPLPPPSKNVDREPLPPPPDPRDTDADRDRDRERARAAAGASKGRDRDRGSSDRDPSAPLSSNGASGGEVRATIGGKRFTFGRATILGNWRHGFGMQITEAGGSGTPKSEIDAMIDADIDRGRELPVRVVYLQITDEKANEGVKELFCSGRGDLILDRPPKLPKRLPRDELDLGEVTGSLSLRMFCSRDSREYGVFPIEGKIVARVILTPPDL